MTTPTDRGQFLTSGTNPPGVLRRAVDPDTHPQRGPGPGRLVVSEWTKLWSLRSTWWTLAAALALGISLATGVAGAASAGGDFSTEELQLGTDDVALILGATGLAALAFGVLGALQMSSEYASGTISVSLTAVPKRWPVVAAKAAVLVAVVAPLSLAISAGALILGDAILEGGLAFSWPAVLGNTAYLVAVAVLGLGLATVIRSTAMSVTLLMAIVFVLPPLVALLPWGFIETAATYFPSTAGESLISTASDAAPLGDVAAIRTLIAWSVAPLVAGAVLLVRRDA